MFDNWRHPLPVLLAALATACASIPTTEPLPELPDVMLSGLVIFNQGQSYISAARVLVPATGQFVSCGNIAPQAPCATGFPERLFSGNDIEITWSQGGNIFSTGALQLALTEEVIAAGAATVRVIIAGPGSAGAELVPIE